MKRHFSLVLSTLLSLLLLGPVSQAQKEIQNAAKQRKAFEKTLKVLANPTANYETKEAAVDAVASLPYPLANGISQAMFLQNNEAISSEGVNALFSSFTPASYRKDNLKFVCDNILRAKPQAQSALLLALTPSIGIQTRENELLYHALSQEVVRDYTRNTTPLESKKNEALSHACLALSLSPHFGTEDRALLMKAARISKFFPL